MSGTKQYVENSGNTRQSVSKEFPLKSHKIAFHVVSDEPNCTLGTLVAELVSLL